MQIQKFHRPTILISFGLLAVLSLVTFGIAYLYISNEKTFYFWDYSNYSSKTSSLVTIFRESPLQAIKAVRRSLAEDYNLLPCAPLIPFILIFGDSRLVYIISCALVYILPFSLVVGAITTRILPAYPHAVFWSTAFLTLLLPPTWVSTLRGYPDIGAAIFIGLAIFVSLKDLKLQSRWQVPLIGFLLALAILFRRHFAYSARAFLVAMFLQGFIVFSNEVRNEPRRALKNLTRYTILISLIGLSSLAALTLLAPKFLVNIITTNYRFLYASYEKSLAENFQYYGEVYGWLFWSLTVLAFSAGTLTRVLLPLKTSFILIFGSISLIQWGLLSRQLGIHYTTHFTWLVALGLTALFWTTWLILRDKARILMLVAVIILLTSNAVMGLTSLGIFHNSIRPFFSASQPPIVRQDYDEINRLIDYLRQLSPERKPIFVAASSGILNDSLLQVAQEQIYGRKFLWVIDTPDVDSRDYYPLSPLLEAQYVIVATPFQHHLPPEEQDVVKVVVDAFTENWGLIRDFRRLPKQFVLEEGVKVSIYERNRLTSAETILQTLNLMQERIQPKPSSQSDWIVFSKNRKKQLSEIGNNLNGTVNIKADFTKAKPTYFLYFGSIPEEIKVTGNFSDLKCSNLSEFSIRLSTLNQQGERINTTEKLQFSKAPANFSLLLPGKNAAYLRLDLVSRDRSKTPGSCYININNLTVSKKI